MSLIIVISLSKVVVVMGRRRPILYKLGFGFPALIHGDHGQKWSRQVGTRGMYTVVGSLLFHTPLRGFARGYL